MNKMIVISSYFGLVYRQPVTRFAHQAVARRIELLLEFFDSFWADFVSTIALRSSRLNIT